MKEVNHEVYFQHADKHQSFLQVNITILGVHVCVCVLSYSFKVKASFICKDVWGILEGTDQQFCVVSITVGASAKFLHLCT